MKTILDRALNAWNSCSVLRERRERYKRFTYGRQWDDPVRDPDTGRVTTEREVLSRDGRPPLTNNMIRQLVKCVVGRFRVYRSNQNPDTAQISRHAARLHIDNELDELDSRLLEEFLIWGCAIQRLGQLPGNGADGAVVNNVSMERFFLSLPRDPRGRDIRLAGMLHDLTPEEIAMEFCGGKRRRAIELIEKTREIMSGNTFAIVGMPVDGADFHHSNENGKVRVVEVWSEETVETLRCHDTLHGTYMEYDMKDAGKIDNENSRRLKAGEAPIVTRWVMGRCWKGRWLLGDGTLLREERDRIHPFVIKLYPLVDGEVHSLVEDVVDQQKYVNRLVNLIDRMMASSAKGALLFPVDCLAEGMELTHVAKAWSATDSIIPYKFRPGDEPPRQLNPSVGDIGAKDLLRLEMQMFQNVSGIGDALLGRDPGGGVGAERYTAQVENATVAIRDLMDTFLSMLRQRDKRLIEFL